MSKDLGVDTYRFSIEWSKIEPVQGKIDQSALAHYHDLIDELLINQLTPMITLHHFSHPQWFEELGGFANESQLHHFVRFSEIVFLEYSKKVQLWCTINEPEVVQYLGFIEGSHPPGKHSILLASQVLRNLMKAHVMVYKKLKSLQPYAGTSRIGIVKDIFQTDPFQRWNPIHWLLAWAVNQIMNESILNFFEHGVFRYLIYTSHTDLTAMQTLDFIGLNYYSHVNVNPLITDIFHYEVREEDRRLQTEMNYTLYGEGIFRALKRLSVLKIPIYITENGCPDSEDKGMREKWIERYLYAVGKAIQDGVDVRGFMYWTFTDNFGLFFFTSFYKYLILLLIYHNFFFFVLLHVFNQIKNGHLDTNKSLVCMNMIEKLI